MAPFGRVSTLTALLLAAACLSTLGLYHALRARARTTALTDGQLARRPPARKGLARDGDDKVRLVEAPRSVPDDEDDILT